MRDTPLLIGYRESETPLVSLEVAIEQGCQGISFELQLRPLGSSLSNRMRTSRYPRLQDVFEQYGEHLFLDIGVNVKGMESEILEIVRHRPSRRNYVVSSALPEVVMELKARSATLPVGLVCKRAAELASWRDLPADYVIVHHPLITRKLIRLIHDGARNIFAWAVNDAKTMARMAGWGVDGIISNDPQLLIETLG